MSVRSKIRSLDELSRISRDARAAGETVVLCHGVFDLLHMGHVRHLEHARREGTLLIVTCTADKYVNKGPGRPIFPEQMRAEMLAALAYVDYVGINPAATAEPLLRGLAPSVYVKGSDYENPEDDITGGIQRERSVVEEHGGRMVFTKDITFSSSSLINRYLDVYDPPLRDLLDELRAEDAERQLKDLIEKVADFRVLLVGDTIIDEYQYVSPLGKSPKENMIATLFENKELFAGGVVAAANHVAGFCREVEVLSVLGADDPHEDVVRAAAKPNVKLNLLHRQGAPTTRKCRFIEPAYLRKLFEVYHMNDKPLAGDEEARLVRAVEETAGSFDLVIVTDFGHGMLTPAVIAALSAKARFLAVNAQSNSANMGYNLITRYKRADYVCIDAPEARLALGNKFADLSEVVGVGLAGRIACDRMIVTAGKHGCVTYQKDAVVRRIPAFTKTVVDTVGAGDAFLAVTSPLVAAGGRMDLVGFIGNAVGAMKVGIVGHRQSVEKTPLLKFITALMK